MVIVDVVIVVFVTIYCFVVAVVVVVIVDVAAAVVFLVVHSLMFENIFKQGPYGQRYILMMMTRLLDIFLW